MMENNKINTIDEISAELAGNDLVFYRRVWSTDIDVYRARLKAIGFMGMQNVLDAGCGMGQWTICLAELNEKICAIDYSSKRIEIVRQLTDKFEMTNIETKCNSIDSLDYPDNYFGGIFCYSVLYMTDYRKSLQEFYRVLKPNGKLYVCTNGLGWYLYNVMSPHNPTEDYDPVIDSINAIENSFSFLSLGKHQPGKHLFIPSSLLLKELNVIGFNNVRVGAEGTLKSDYEQNVESFFASEYRGIECVYEILANKKPI